MSGVLPESGSQKAGSTQNISADSGKLPPSSTPNAVQPDYCSSIEEFLKSENPELWNVVCRSWDMQILVNAINTLYESPDDIRLFYESILPKIKDMADSGHMIEVLNMFKKNNIVYLTRDYVAMMLCNAFTCKVLCATPKNSNCTLNFQSLYSAGKTKFPSNKIEKMKGLLKYFEHVVTARELEGVLVYKKSIIHDVSFLSELTSNSDILTQVEIQTNKSINDAADGIARVCFSNKKIGACFFEDGWQQEERKIVASPELLLAKLFGKMDDNEAIVVSGTQDYTASTGYSAESFKITPRSGHNELYEGGGPIIAIDALKFSPESYMDQFKKENVNREILKAYAGFSAVECSTIATGCWGGGACGGDPILKMQIQWIAATLAGKKLHYHIFVTDDLKTEFINVLSNWKNRPICELYSSILSVMESPGTEESKPAEMAPAAAGHETEHSEPCHLMQPHNESLQNTEDGQPLDDSDEEVTYVDDSEHVSSVDDFEDVSSVAASIKNQQMDSQTQTTESQLPAPICDETRPGELDSAILIADSKASEELSPEMTPASGQSSQEMEPEAEICEHCHQQPRKETIISETQNCQDESGGASFLAAASVETQADISHRDSDDLPSESQLPDQVCDTRSGRPLSCLLQTSPTYDLYRL